MKTFIDLLDENVVHVLSYLRAVDLASARAANRKIFSAERLHGAIQTLLKDVYDLPSSSPAKKSQKVKELLITPDLLYAQELHCLTTALHAQPPLGLKGFWISTTWVSNAKKFVDGRQRNFSERNRTPTKRRFDTSRRREADFYVPSSSMTTDIVCEHGGLALSSSNSHSKRKQVSSRMWHFLRRFYPDGPEFRCTMSSECQICVEANMELKAVKSGQKDAVITERHLDLVPDALVALAARKSGVPMHCVTARVAFYNELAGDDIVRDQPESDPAAGLQLSGEQLSVETGDLQQPLVPGLYNLVPRTWLKAWRNYVKDVKAPRLPHLNCTALMCQAHSQLVVPPHVEEYLIGLRRGLLSGLGAYPGEMAEIVSADEWDALQDVFRDAADFNVRFCLDGVGVTWNTGVCLRCNPFTYRPLVETTRKKKNGARAPHDLHDPELTMG